MNQRQGIAPLAVVSFMNQQDCRRQDFYCVGARVLLRNSINPDVVRGGWGGFQGVIAGTEDVCANLQPRFKN